MKKIQLDLPEFEVIGVIISALNKVKISREELQQAEVDGLSVLAQEDLDDLLNMIYSGSHLSDTIEFIRSKIPSKNLL